AVGQALLLVAHHEQHRPLRVVNGAIVHRPLEMGADDQSFKTFPPGEEFLLIGLRQRYCEERTHRRPYRLDRERIRAVAHKDHALGANGIRRADDRAEVAGIANPVQRHIDVARRWPDILEWTVALLEHAHYHLRVFAPGDG